MNIRTGFERIFVVLSVVSALFAASFSVGKWQERPTAEYSKHALVQCLKNSVFFMDVKSVEISRLKNGQYGVWINGKDGGSITNELCGNQYSDFVFDAQRQDMYDKVGPLEYNSAAFEPLLALVAWLAILWATFFAVLWIARGFAKKQT